MKVEVELHTDGITDICNEALKTGIFTASQKALADCNKYCKMDYGALIFSSVIHTEQENAVNTSKIPEKPLGWANESEGSDLENGILRWVMPYAERQYELPKAYKDKHPDATNHWCQHAYENHGDEWQRAFIKGLHKGGLK